MVIGSLGVGGDASPGQGRARLPAGQPGDEEGSGLGVIRLGIGPHMRLAGHPIHGPLKGLGQPLMQVRGVGGGLHRRDPESIQSDPLRGLPEKFVRV